MKHFVDDKQAGDLACAALDVVDLAVDLDRALFVMDGARRAGGKTIRLHAGGVDTPEEVDELMVNAVAAHLWKFCRQPDIIAGSVAAYDFTDEVIKVMNNMRGPHVNH